MDDLTPEQRALIQPYMDEMSEQMKAYWEEEFHRQEKYKLPPGHLEVQVRWVQEEEDDG